MKKNLKLFLSSLFLLLGIFFANAQSPFESEAVSTIYNFNIEFTPSEDINLDEDISQLALRSKSYALIIGVDQYADESYRDLQQPVKDAMSLKKTLTELYQFDDDHATVLSNARYQDIIAELDKLSKKITPNDNLLIFYAGHGILDNATKIGYWLPADATKDKRNWLPNSMIRDYIKGINSRHTLLVVDACFSGSIFSTRSALPDASNAIQKLYSQRSRRAITSGAETEVEDRSVFLEYLVKELRKNTEPYLPAERLYFTFKETVMNNSKSPQIPQYGVIEGAKDEGGDFIFARKK